MFYFDSQFVVLDQLTLYLLDWIHLSLHSCCIAWLHCSSAQVSLEVSVVFQSVELTSLCKQQVAKETLCCFYSAGSTRFFNHYICAVWHVHDNTAAYVDEVLLKYNTSLCRRCSRRRWQRGLQRRAVSLQVEWAFTPLYMLSQSTHVNAVCYQQT